MADGRRRGPDLQETVEQIVAEGDLVVTPFLSKGTFDSEPGGATKRREVTMREFAIHRIRDGKIVEQWTAGGILDIRPIPDPPASQKP